MGDVINGRFPDQGPDRPMIGLYLGPDGRPSVAGLSAAADQAYAEAFGPMPTLDDPYGQRVPAPRRELGEHQDDAPRARTLRRRRVDPARPAAPAGPVDVDPGRTPGVARQVSARLAQWYQAEAGRRGELREERGPDLRRARREYQIAKRADRGGKTSRVTRRSRRDYRRLRRHYPNAMWWLTAKTLAGAGAATFVGGWWLQERAGVRLWHVAVDGLAALALGTAAVLAVRYALRHRPRSGLVPTSEERALMGRLDPSYWAGHAKDRGLEGTMTGKPELTEAGIRCQVRLDGQWTAGKLRAAEEQIRALLGMRTALKVPIKTGERGGWAVLTVRTRSAVDKMDMTWTPERRGIGVDTITGTVVDLDPYRFMLVAGVTGMGKSVYLRPLIAMVLQRPDAAVIYIDPKQMEAGLWKGKMRTAAKEPEMYALLKEVLREVERRQDQCSGTATWIPTPDAPELVVIIDEGAAIKRMGKKKPYKDILEICEHITTQGRATKVWLIWATQYPTKEDGIPAQVAEMMLDRIALTVESAQADRIIFGDKASDTGWQPSELSGQPGEALIKLGRKRKPHPVQGWYMDDNTVLAMPAGLIWHGQDQDARQPLKAVPTGADVDEPEDEIEDQDDVDPGLLGTDARILALIATADGPIAQGALPKAAELAPSTVSAAVNRLIADGQIERVPGSRSLLREPDREADERGA